MNRKLKLGILLDSYDIPAWIYRMLEQIAASNHAEILLVILNGDTRNTSRHISRSLKYAVHSLFQKIDQKVFSRRPDALALRNSRHLLSTAPSLTVNPLQNGNQYTLRDSDINEIQGYRLDILIKIGFRNFSGNIGQCSKYGVWVNDFFNQAEYPPGFWEVMEGKAETVTTLRILGNEGEDNILYRSSFPTFPYSPTENRNVVCWGSASLLPRQIALLHLLGEEKFFAKLETNSADQTLSHSEPSKPPSNVLALRLIAGLAVKILSAALSRTLYVDQWYLMFDLNKHELNSLSKFRKIMPPKGSFFADPMLVKQDDRYYVFVEEYEYKKKKGLLSVLSLDENSNYSKPIPILEKNYHLSYPFVFDWQEKFYLVPESAENRTIDLYECIDFPGKWKFKMSLIENVKAVDTTLWFFNNKWWLFTGMIENEEAFPHVGLFLFFSENLFTNQWHPHPLNPVVSDVKKARPAGRIFQRNGRTYRPSQDSTKGYGGGFDWNEIVTLSETEYEEAKTCSVRPGWDKKTFGAHTYGTVGNLTVIDAVTKRIKFI
jgi:hypothetical protein